MYKKAASPFFNSLYLSMQSTRTRARKVHPKKRLRGPTACGPPSRRHVSVKPSGPPSSAACVGHVWKAKPFPACSLWRGLGLLGASFGGGPDKVHPKRLENAFARGALVHSWPRVRSALAHSRPQRDGEDLICPVLFSFVATGGSRKGFLGHGGSRKSFLGYRSRHIKENSTCSLYSF